MIMKSFHQITDVSHLLSNYMSHWILKLLISSLADRHLKWICSAQTSVLVPDSNGTLSKLPFHWSVLHLVCHRLTLWYRWGKFKMKLCLVTSLDCNFNWRARSNFEVLNKKYFMLKNNMNKFKYVQNFNLKFISRSS
jgi:hypothetical protein